MSNNNDTERLLANLAATVIAYVNAGNAFTQDVQRLITAMGQAHERQERMDRKIVVIRDDVAENKMTADAHKAIIDANKAGIAENKAKIEETEMKTEANKAKIAETEMKTDANKAMIDDSKAKIADIEMKTDANKAMIDDSKAKIADIEMKTEANKAMIDDNTEDISKLFRAFKKLKKNFEDRGAMTAARAEAVGSNVDSSGPVYIGPFWVEEQREGEKKGPMRPCLYCESKPDATGRCGKHVGKPDNNPNKPVVV